MGSREYLAVCKAKIVDYVNGHMDKTDNNHITMNDVYVVWYSKTLQNHKALLSTTLSDGMYYEMTFNGDKSECTWMLTRSGKMSSLRCKGE